MPLTKAGVAASIDWAQQEANDGSEPSVQGPDALSFSAAPDVADVDEVQRVRLTFVANGTQTIDLRSFVNLNRKAVTLAGVYGVIVKPVGCSVLVTPGASNGLAAWFVPAAGIRVPDGGVELHHEPAPTAVDATHKALDVTATMTGGVTSATVDVAILGGT